MIGITLAAKSFKGMYWRAPPYCLFPTNCVYHDAYCGEECEFGQIIGMPAFFKTPKEYVEKALAINNRSKNKKAHELNIPIITEDEFIEKFQE